MLSEGHPHAWDVDTASQHLDAGFRRHYMAKDSELVVTAKMRQLATSIPTALDRGAAIAVSGPLGAGKSTTLVALEAVADVNTCIVDIPRGATERGQWEEITTAMTGQPTTGTAKKLQNDAREFLSAVPTLLIVDEAQHLSLSAMLQLRWLWGHNFPRFAIILAGSDLFTHLETAPSVNDRIDRRLELRHHSRERMLTLITAHHPMAAATNPTLLAQIDDAHAHGSWRKWSTLLKTIYNDFKHTGALTYPIASQAILTISGDTPALLPAGPGAPQPWAANR